MLPRAMPRTDMREFWDERARENAAFFVDNNLDYAHPDMDRFWDEGRRGLDLLLGTLGVAVTSDDHVVEIGCGVGRLTRVLSERAAAVTAIDVSREMLDRARELNPGLDNVQWRLGDGRSLAGVADACADACVSHVVFQHIPDPRVTLGYVREMGRVLKPGGWSAFQISNDPDVHRRRASPRQWAGAVRAALGRAPRGQAHPAWRGSAVDLADLDRAADDGAMDVERVTGSGSQFCLVLTRRRAEA